MAYEGPEGIARYYGANATRGLEFRKSRSAQMHLPEFVLLVLATIAAIAAGLAVLASRFSIARVLFWIAGVSFWSLGVLWSATSQGYSLPTQMVVSAIIGAVAAAGLTWVLWEIGAKERAEQHTRHTESAPGTPTTRGPTLEAINKSTIDATGAQIPGDLPFQFGKAADGSLIAMPGIQVTKTEGGWIINPGAVNLQFPSPPEKYARMTILELKRELESTAQSLPQFHNQFMPISHKQCRMRKK